MTRSDDVPAEMTDRPELDDAAAARLLAGRSVDASPELSALVLGLRAMADQPVAPRGDLATLLVEGFDPARPPVAADVPAWTPAPVRDGWARHPAVRVAALSLAAKVLLGGGVAVAGVGTAAGLGALPDPVQDRVAGVVAALTPFELPRTDAGAPAPARPGSERPQPPAPAERPVAPAPPAVQPPGQPPVAPGPGSAGQAPPQRPLAPTPGAPQRTTPPPAAERATPPPAPERATPPPAAERPQPGPADPSPRDASTEEPRGDQPPVERAQQAPPADPPAAPAPAADGTPAAVTDRP